MALGTVSPVTHLIEYLRSESVEGPAPVEPEQEESLGLDGAAEALDLAEKRVRGAEAGGAVQGGRVEVAGAAGAPEEEGERDGV